jgi:hypothetical protein
VEESKGDLWFGLGSVKVGSCVKMFGFENVREKCMFVDIKQASK